MASRIVEAQVYRDVRVARRKWIYFKHKVAPVGESTRHFVHQQLAIWVGLSLKNSGCTMLKLGLESGNQGVLDRMEKGIDLHLAGRVLENLHAAGIRSYVYLLFGTPAETEPEARQTLDFVEKYHKQISFLNLAIFNLPICSIEASSLEVSNFYEGDLSIYRNFVHPHGWNRRQVRHFLDTIFKRSPAAAAMLKRDPPFFTSNHAPFLQT